MSSINFTANLVKRTQIQKSDDYKTYHPADAAIVELDKYDKNDVKALYDTSVLWNYQGAKYSSEILHEAVKGYDYDDIEREHYLAVTTQTDDFENLEPKKILGLMLFSETNNEDNEINWLQVRPNTNNNQTWKREYKKVGAVFVDLLKNMKLGKNIHVQSAPEAVGFYKAMGFVNRDDDGASSLYLTA